MFGLKKVSGIRLENEKKKTSGCSIESLIHHAERPHKKWAFIQSDRIDEAGAGLTYRDSGKTDGQAEPEGGRYMN